uniref:Uncharacterized protein n=1 Tax=Glossina palpalis gambiensis TaxID=67801 RepID=A0A1B0B1Y9_9MUSC
MPQALQRLGIPDHRFVLHALIIATSSLADEIGPKTTFTNQNALELSMISLTELALRAMSGEKHISSDKWLNAVVLNNNRQLRNTISFKASSAPYHQQTLWMKP